MHGSVFLNDPHGYSKVLLRGIEPALLTSYALLFIGFDIAFSSVAGACLSVYIIDLSLRFIRAHFGERNIAEKTLLDYKFLI
jgi:hypothetical protein